MTCSHCPPAIEKAIRAVKGVQSASVNLAMRTAKVDYDPVQTKAAEILRAIRSVGYAAGTATMRVPIKNMHCSSCALRVELALKMTPGVIAARASLAPNAVDIEYQPERTDFQQLRRSIESSGYRVAEPKIESADATLDPAEAANEQEYRSLMQKFWLAAAISLPVMALSYPDLIPGLREWMPMGSDTRRIVWALLGVLSLPVLLW
ncbi:MAG: heavy metal translocating P-type ATPase, partial [Mesorhizobium sp.]